MKKATCLILTLTILLFACKKNDNDNWSEEDRVYYNNVIALQETGYENYTTWLQTMDSLEAINLLQQFFLADSSVTFATIGTQGIAVQYSNGMRGGIFINPDDEFGEDSLDIELPIKMTTSDINEKSLVNSKKAIFLNPSYWDRMDNANSIVASYNTNLPRAGFSLQKIYKGIDASVDRFTELKGFGLIHVYSHGWPWPDNENISDVYMMTGEKINETTTPKYWQDIIKGNLITVIKAETSSGVKEFVYFVSEKFIASHNDFSKDTILFYGGFCYSYLGSWPEMKSTFANGDYFGFSWRVRTTWNCNLAKDLVKSLTDTLKDFPVNSGIWYTSPNPIKYRYDEEYQLNCQLKYTGDATLTMWKGLPKIDTYGITNITETSATGGGNVISDGGAPVTARGVCWSKYSNPTIDDSHTTDGSGLGEFSSNISGLTKDTPYAVRAYATNSEGTAYGTEEIFTATVGFYIGQSYGGGIIFYIDGTGEHGLIVDTSAPATVAEWGCYDNLLGGTYEAIGTGQANTIAIINGCGEAGIAARICNDLVLNGYDDWFLPSKDELNQIYIQQNLLGYFYGGGYWSSSESYSTYSCSQWFTVGDPYCLSDKRSPYYVRAVRAF
jgi:hypothetical protein